MRLHHALAVLTAAFALTVAAPAVHAGGDWNDGEVKWVSYEDGLKQAKASKKPMLLIFYTEWCPHCSNYSKIFHDPKVVTKSKEFVMVRLDADKNKDLGKQFSPDGSYIPRTFFVTSAGVVDPDLHAPRDQFKYFYDEKDPNSILGGMDAAQKKLAN
jgi:thiol-disulfide isomerase/thioredoxin